MDLDLNQLQVFLKVIDEGGFTAAGRALGIPKSRVSRMVSDLEANLGVRLLQRTTRQSSLTEIGEAYYKRCHGLVAQISQAHEEISDQASSAMGMLRVAVSIADGSDVMGHHLSIFQSKFPDIRLEVVHMDNPINLVQEGFDLGIYIGELPDSSLVARTLTHSQSLLCASPDFLARHPELVHPRDLQDMVCVKNGTGFLPEEYHFVKRASDESIRVRVPVNISTNMMGGVVSSVIHGAGVAELPMILAADPVLEGRLVPVLNDWELKQRPISLAYPSRSYLPNKVRYFIDFLVHQAQQLDALIDNVDDPVEKLSIISTAIKNY